MENILLSFTVVKNHQSNFLEVIMVITSFSVLWNRRPLSSPQEILTFQEIWVIVSLFLSAM